MQKKSNWAFTLLALVLFVTSCDSDAVYDEYQTVPNKWHKDSIINFKVAAPDSIKPYNLYITLRNTNDYQFNNLYLIVEMNYPNGKVLKDTIEYKMAAPNGKLLGTGFSDIKENKLWYKGFETPFVFSETGEYEIHVQHAMRRLGQIEGISNLEGITDIGIRIENVNNSNIQ